MSISKRSMDVEGFHSDPRPYPTLNFIKKHAPQKIGNFEYLGVKDTKPTFTFCYYRGTKVHETLEFQIKMIRIDEWPRQTKTLVDYIEKLLLERDV
jgi:hypothetical protein